MSSAGWWSGHCSQSNLFLSTKFYADLLKKPPSVSTTATFPGVCLFHRHEYHNDLPAGREDGHGCCWGGSGDGTYFIWLVAWYQKALFQLKISPFFAPFLNYPQGWNLATTDITPAQVVLALPGSLLFGPIWGFNFAMLLSFILSGWGMYLWVKHLTGDPFAGLVAGTVFAFLPFRMAHFIVGHLSLAGTQWFPFYFWGLFDLLKQEKFSWKPVLMAGIAAGLIGLTSPYYVYMTILISAVFLLGFILFKGYKRLEV